MILPAKLFRGAEAPLFWNSSNGSSAAYKNNHKNVLKQLQKTYCLPKYLLSDGCSNSRKALYLSPQSSEYEKKYIYIKIL